jgi:anti-sigma B factor antagonist
MAELSEEAPLTIEVARGDEGYVVKLAGELDLSNTERVHAAVDHLLRAGTGSVVFDLAGLRFMDSSGIMFFLLAAGQTARLILLNPSDVVRQVVRATGLGSVLHLEP